MGDHDRAAAEYEAALRLLPRIRRGPQQSRTDARRAGSTGRRDRGVQRGAADRSGGSRRRATTWRSRTSRQGRLRRAIPEFEEAVRQQPGSAESQMNLASALAASGTKREALPHFEAAARLGGDPIKVHYAWGGVLMDLGDMAEATKQFQTVLPDQSDVRAGRARSRPQPGAVRPFERRRCRRCSRPSSSSRTTPTITTISARRWRGAA